jgi:hypothetical protein
VPHTILDDHFLNCVLFRGWYFVYDYGWKSDVMTKVSILPEPSIKDWVTHIKSKFVFAGGLWVISPQ